MKPLWHYGTSFLLAVSAAHSWAASATGNDLLQKMRTSPHDSITWVEGFVHGFSAGNAAEIVDKAGVRRPSNNSVCIPATATVGQVHDTIKQYIERHPEERHMEAGVLALFSLIDAFPCAKQAL